MLKKIYYKYRCTNGKYIEATRLYVGNINKAIAKLIKEYRHSSTPIVEIEGKPVDIRRFLQQSLNAAKDEQNYWQSKINSLTHEIGQYNKIFD